MLYDLPMYVNIVFIITTLLTVFLFYKATSQSRLFLIIAGLWMLLQARLGFSGFYLDTETVPPRFPLLAGPPMLLILALFLTQKGRRFIDTVSPKYLTLLHVVRIPVELCLYWLFLNKAVPQLMTFEGRNFDILAGITAPLIFYFGYVKNKLGKSTLLIWNFICLALLLNIVVHAILSVPTGFQTLALDQPNRAVLYFPYVWLPSIVVPLVFLSHFICIRKLIGR